jgi:mannose-6-phosphate isomerase-like protein (cupin superfamily)
MNFEKIADGDEIIAIIIRAHYQKDGVLFVRSGKLKVDFYSNDRQYLESTVLGQGDVILLASGGHGFEMLEETELIEVKQGPYAGDEDKEHL